MDLAPRLEISTEPVALLPSGREYLARAVTNASYKDFGRTLGWWWGWSARSFGWGIAQAGHNFIIGNPDDLLAIIPAVLLGHMGKHGPVLLVRQNEVPESVARYLEMVRPFASGPTATIRNHGWIIGDEAHLSWDVQKQIHRLLTPRGLELDMRSPEQDLAPTGDLHDELILSFSRRLVLPLGSDACALRAAARCAARAPDL